MRSSSAKSDLFGRHGSFRGKAIFVRKPVTGLALKGGWRVTLSIA